MHPKSYYAAIADDAAANGETDYEVAFARMKDETILVTQDIPASEIRSYLILSDRWLPIKRSQEDIAEITRDALETFEAFRVSDPALGGQVMAKLTQILDGLIAAGLADATNKAIVLGMASRAERKWPGILPGHVQNALQWRIDGVI